MSQLRISIALCTYNGSQYLPPQLESLLGQSRRPDELVVCDDGSTDGTVAFLEDFAERAPFAVRIVRNTVRLGPTKNFEQAISLCNGDLIACCDQDDYWMESKLATLGECLTHDQDAGYAFSDMVLWRGGELNTDGGTMWQGTGFDSARYRAYSAAEQVRELLKYDRVTGATLLFKAQFRPYLLPISEHWFHDGWIAMLLSCLGHKGLPVNSPLIYYRLHAGQQTAVGRETSLQRIRRSRHVKYEAYLRQAQRFADMQERLQKMGAAHAVSIPAAVFADLKEKERHLTARATFHTQPQWRRVGPVLRELQSGRYHRYSETWNCVLKDLLL